MRKRLMQTNDGEEYVLTITGKVNGTGKRYAYISRLYNGREVLIEPTYRMIDDYEYMLLEDSFMNGIPKSILVTPKQYSVLNDVFFRR